MLDIKIIPYEDNEYADMLSFDWSCVKFTETYMQIQLSFTNPLYVSNGGTDYIEVRVINPIYFERKAYPDNLPKLYYMSSKLFSMMEDNILTETFSTMTPSLKDGIDVGVLFDVSINFVF